MAACSRSPLSGIPLLLALLAASPALAAGAEITGTVVDEAGPVAGATVELHVADRRIIDHLKVPGGRVLPVPMLVPGPGGKMRSHAYPMAISGPPALTGKTDASGGFRLEADPAKAYWLLVHAEGRPEVGLAFQARQAEHFFPARLFLGPERVVRGTVFLAPGKPAANLQVDVDPADGPLRTVRTDARGAFSATLGGDPALETEIKVWPREGKKAFETVRGRKIPPLKILLPMPTAVEGVVLLGERPLARAEVWLGDQMKQADEKGRYRFSEPKPGLYRLTAKGKGKQSDRITVTVETHRTRTVRLRLATTETALMRRLSPGPIPRGPLEQAPARTPGEGSPLPTSPEDPAEALAALQRLGEAPPCQARETIVETPPTPPGGIPTGGHAHHFDPAETLPRLAGKSGEIVPHTRHWNEAVVRRASELLCRIQDDEAKEALTAVYRRMPCRQWAVALLHGAGLPWPRKTPKCGQDSGRGGPGEELSRLRREDIDGWHTRSSLALARAIAAGEDGALERALALLGAADTSLRRQAAAALAAIDTAGGWLALMRAYRAGEPWEWKDGLSVSRWDRRDFMEGIGGLALRSAAAKQKKTRGEVLRALLPAMTPEEHKYFWERLRTSDYALGHELGRALLGAPPADEALAGARIVVDAIASARAIDPVARKQRWSLFARWRRQKDLKSLRWVVATPRRSAEHGDASDWTGLERKIAAIELARAGDVSGLFLLEDTRGGLDDLRDLHDALEAATPRSRGESRKQLQSRLDALMKRWGPQLRRDKP